MTHDVPLSFLSFEEFPQLSRIREVIISTRSFVGSHNGHQVHDASWVVASLTNLGINCCNGNRLPEAEEILLHAIKIEECVNHASHPDLLRPLITLGAVFARAHRYLEAERVLLRALSIAGKTDGKTEEHKLTLINLIHIYQQQKRSEFEAQMREALTRLLDENAFVIKDRHTQREE